MTSPLAADLARTIREATEAAIARAVNSAVATVATDSPLTLTWNGGTYPARRVASYTPVVGDLVAVLRHKNQLVVLGSIVD